MPTSIDVEDNATIIRGEDAVIAAGQQSLQCPYRVGNTLKLYFSEQDDAPTAAQIIRILGPFSLSCSMIVKLNHSELKSQYELKLYDRRFAHQLRIQNGAADWTPEIETDLRDLDDTGDAERFVEEWQALNETVGSAWLEESDWQRWDPGKQEAYLQTLCCNMYKNEHSKDGVLVDVEDALGHVWLQTSSESSTRAVQPQLDVPGVLLKYTPGEEIPDN